MAYNSSHTGPELDAAVSLLGTIQATKDSVSADKAAVQTLSNNVDSKAAQVNTQNANVNTKATEVAAAAAQVEQARSDVEVAATGVIQSRDEAAASAAAAVVSKNSAASSATASATSQTSASQSAAASAQSEISSAQSALASSSSAQEAAASAVHAEEVIDGFTVDLNRLTGQIEGGTDLLLESGTGQTVSSLRTSSKDAAVWIAGTDELARIDTLNKQMELKVGLVKSSDSMLGTSGFSDYRDWEDLRTLPDSQGALVLTDKAGAVALRIDVTNKKVSTEYSFEASVEQRPPTVFVDTPPRLERNTSDPFYTRTGRVYQATATIERSGPGRYWSAWRADNTTNAEAPGNFAVLAYSDDNCQTMKEYGYFTFSPASPDKHLVDPMLWKDPSGNLWLFFGVFGNNKGFDGVQGTWAVICQNPNAQFPVWGRPFRLSYFADPRHPVQINGQWYLMLDGWRHDAAYPPRYMEYVGPRVHKLNWQSQKLEFVSHLPPNNGTSYSGFFETEILQRSDGSVIALLRSLSASVKTLYSISNDMMKTWSPWAEYTVIDPSSSSRMWLGRSPSGRTVFCWNNDAVRRTLTLGLSDDDGATYPYRVLLEPVTSGQVTYPVVTFGDGGEIFVIYDNERTSGKRQIRIAKVLEQEVVAGTSVPVVYIVSNPAA